MAVRGLDLSLSANSMVNVMDFFFHELLVFRNLLVLQNLNRVQDYQLQRLLTGGFKLALKKE